MMLTMLPATAFAADETGQEQVDSQEPGTSSGSETALEYVFKAANVSGKYGEDSYKVDVTKKRGQWFGLLRSGYLNHWTTRA